MKKRILLIDNYDSFTHILCRTIDSLHLSETVIVKNDALFPSAVSDFDAIIISPGPGLPAEAGICCELIRKYHREIPVLGVCLGHQAIATVFGGTLYNLSRVYHGEMTTLEQCSDPGLYRGIHEPIRVGLYHSWAVDQSTLPESLEITALSSEGIIMSLKHRSYPITGIQYHPESVISSHGKEILRNWLQNI
jgi:anthranilate synthase component 2